MTRWKVLERIGEDGDTIEFHVVPTNSTHALASSCDCKPKLEPNPIPMYVHQQPN
jgi:hypothetical protein